MKQKSILAVIPARGGSKGVLKKNIKPLGGKPLIKWTIEAAKKSSYINRIIISTDDEEISDICLKENVQVIKRPEYLATDSSPTIDVVTHSLENLKAEGYIPDIVLLLQCTSPFRTSRQIDEAITLFISKSDNFDSVISVTLNEYPPQWLKCINEEGKLLDFIKYNKTKLTRRQDFDFTYKLNGAIYVGKPEKILENYGFETNNSLAYIMDSYTSVDIDTQDDFKYGEFLLQSKISK